MLDGRLLEAEDAHGGRTVAAALGDAVQRRGQEDERSADEELPPGVSDGCPAQTARALTGAVTVNSKTHTLTMKLRTMLMLVAKFLTILSASRMTMLAVKPPAACRPMAAHTTQL